MNPHPELDSPDSTARTRTLGKLLGQSEHVKELLEGCSNDLLLVSEAVTREVANEKPTPEIEFALRKCMDATCKVDEATHTLKILNRAFQDAIRDRTMLDHQFAAALEQAGAARHASLHEILTGLPNRTLFNDRLEHGFAQAQRHGWNLAVMFVDLDKFKNINDSYGHDAGDSVLQTIARRLAEGTRGEDTISRHGGDEFLYLAMEMHSEADISALAEKIIGQIQQPCRVRVRDLDVSISLTASIGISVYPKDGASAGMLVSSADQAMYRAKMSQSGYAFAS